MRLQDGKTLVIANPAAKNGEGAQAAYHVRRLLREALGADAVDEVRTEAPGHATELAQQAAGEYGAVVTVGGDGIIHEVANGLMRLAPELRPAMGVVPVGSGNDYARTLGMETRVEDAVAQLLGAQSRTLDAGSVNGEYFVETVSFGLDAAIALDTVERRKHTTKTGNALYFEAGIDQLLHHLDNYQINVQFGEEDPFDVSTIMFAVQIGPTYGGGFRVCPGAQPDDGLFDVCYAHGSWSIPRAVLVFARAKNGKHTNARGIAFAQTDTVHVRFDAPPPAQADGEKVEGTDFLICMHPQALPVLVP